MGLLAEEPADSPLPLDLAPIALRGLACAELDCLAALVLGDWSEVGPHTRTLTAAQFADDGRADLYDGLVGLLSDQPGLGLAERLAAIPDRLLGTISVVLRWSDRPGFEAGADVFSAARDALCWQPSTAGAGR